MPAVIPLAILAGSVGGAAISAHAAGKAADTAANSANSAAQLDYQAKQQQLAFEKQQADLAQNNYLSTQAFNRQVYTDQQQRLQPYRALGAGSIAQLAQPIPRGNGA